MSHKKSEKGQALVLIALAAVGLFAFTALSIDGGMVFSDRRHAQNAADTAALAGALARLRAVANPDQAAKDAGLDRAISNGYGAPTDPDSTVEVYICDETTVLTNECVTLGMPAAADPSDYVYVKITSIVHTTFARIIGWRQVTNMVTAIAKAVPGGPEGIFGGSALVALSPNDPYAISNQGNINLDINNSGVFSNSANNCAFGAGGNSTINADFGYTIANNGSHYCNNLNGQNNGNVGDSSMYQPGDQLAYPPVLDIPTPAISCSGPGSVDDVHGEVFPGTFNSGLNLNHGHYTFMPGSYCLKAGLSIGGSAQVTANYVDIVIEGGDFRVTSTLNCDYILVHNKGGSAITVTGNSDVICTNATFFASKGSVTLEGNGANTFTAPKSGPHPEYKNLLIYMPHGNTSPLKITGNSATEMTGTIMGISAPVTISGNSGSNGLNTAIIGYTVTILGNSNTVINYNPDDQIIQLNPGDIGLTK